MCLNVQIYINILQQVTHMEYEIITLLLELGNNLSHKVYHLLLQGMWVGSLVWEDHTCHGVTEPCPRACAQQQEKPLQ